MNVEVRFYKRFDMDLFALFDAGYPIAELMREAVQGFAHKQPIHIEINDPIFFDSNDKNTFRTRFSIPNDDIETINMLKTIKHRCRSNFCKAVLRNALVNLPLTAYFSYDSDYSLYEGLSDVDTSLFPRLIRLSRDIIDGENPIKRWSKGKIRNFLQDSVSGTEGTMPKSRRKSRKKSGTKARKTSTEALDDNTPAIDNTTHEAKTPDEKVVAKSNARTIAAKFGAEISGMAATGVNTNSADVTNVTMNNPLLDENFIENNVENIPSDDYNEDTENQNVCSCANGDTTNKINSDNATAKSISDNPDVTNTPVVTIPPTVSTSVGSATAGRRRRRFTYDPSEEAHEQVNDLTKTDIRETYRVPRSQESINGHERNNVYEQDAVYAHGNNPNSAGSPEVHRPDAAYETDINNAQPTRMNSAQDTYNTETSATVPPSMSRNALNNNQTQSSPPAMFFTQADTNQISSEDEEPDFENDSLMDSLLDMMGDD